MLLGLRMGPWVHGCLWCDEELDGQWDHCCGADGGSLIGEALFHEGKDAVVADFSSEMFVVGSDFTLQSWSPAFPSRCDSETCFCRLEQGLFDVCGSHRTLRPSDLKCAAGQPP